MKKSLLTFSTLILFGLSLQAQNIGLKGGANFSNLYVDNVDDENMRIGFHLGAYVQFPIFDAFAIQPEILYSTKGATTTYDAGFLQGESSFNLNYIDLPILAIFRLGEALELQIGPYAGFLINSSVDMEGEFDFGDGTFESSESLDRDNFKSLDYGLAAGVAFNFSALQIGARYNLGLQEIADSDAARVFLGDAKNSYIQVFAALRFGTY